MTHPNLQELAQRIHAQNRAAGWWDNPRPRVQTAWLVVTELSEATEAERKGRYADLEAFDKDKEYEFYKRLLGEDNVNTVESFKKAFERHVKDSFQDKIANAVIRLLDFAASEGVATKEPNTQGSPVSNEDTFFHVTDCVYGVVSAINNKHKDKGAQTLHSAISALVKLAEEQRFDLWRHIDLKLKYNQTRGKRHGGKKF